MKCDLEEKCLSEESLSSELSKKCEIIASMEKNIINCEQLNNQHIQDIQRLSSEYELKIKEVTETLKANQLEEKRHLLSQHESECLKMSKQFEAENANLNALLIKKSEELEEFFTKANIATEDIKESYKLTMEQALEDQKNCLQEQINQVRYKTNKKNNSKTFLLCNQ